jgi:predicted membrane protein (TIGR00267 family)
MTELRQLPREIHKHIRARGYIGSSALGVSDGLVTNLAFLSGFAGATSDSQFHLIQIAGVASMLAGAISMFFGGVLAGRSEYELFQADAKREASEIEQEPEEEKTELKNFYVAKGLSQDQADKVVEQIASNKANFLEDILMHELHVHRSKLANPIKMGGVIGLSFLVGALIPLAPFLFFSTRIESLIVAASLSPVFLFSVGAWRGRVVGRKFWRTGLETLLIGVSASLILYLIGLRLVFV